MKLPHYLHTDNWRWDATKTNAVCDLHLAWWGVPLLLLGGLFHRRTIQRVRQGWRPEPR